MPLSYPLNKAESNAAVEYCNAVALLSMPHFLTRNGPAAGRLPCVRPAANRDLIIRPPTVPLNLRAYCRARPSLPRTVGVVSVGLDQSAARNRACEEARAGRYRG